MKKSLIVAAVAATITNVAQAQSSVALYGVLDAGAVYTNSQSNPANGATGASNFEIGSPITGSYLGLRGTEDLGNGLAAIFRLEQGFAAATGSGRNALANRNVRPAYFGLRSADAGTVTLGRQYDSVVDYLSPLTLTGGTGGTLFAHPFDNDNANYGFAANNAIKFTSADHDGLTFGGMYGFSNQAGGFDKNRVYSLGVAYGNGPLTLGAAYLHGSGGGNMGPGALPWDTAFNPTGDPFAALVEVDRRDTYGIGGSYAVGPATVGMVWTHTRLDGSVTGAGTLGQRTVFDNYEVNSRFQLTPSTSLAALYTLTHRRDSLGADQQALTYHQFGLKADYALSRRTGVYAAGMYQATPRDSKANINGVPASATNHQVVLTTGLIHRF